MARAWAQNGTGYDTDEGVQKVAGLVWDTDSLQWVRATQATGSGDAAVATTPKQSRFDQHDETTLYIGTAAVGVGTSEDLWKIKRITFNALTGIPVTIQYANAGASNNQWDQRLLLAYS